jgi:hypothetical protein
MKAASRRAHRKTSHIASSSGRVGNDHFILTADHLLLEVDPSSFELVSAIAEGHVRVHLLDQGSDIGCLVLAKSGIYHPQEQRITLSGWEETRYNGIVEKAPAMMQQEAVLPTDGSFLNPLASREKPKNEAVMEAA